MATPKPHGSDVVQQVQLYFDAGQLGEQHPPYGRLPTTPSVTPPIIVYERGVSAGDLGVPIKPIKPWDDHLAIRDEVASGDDGVVRPTPPPPDEPAPETRPARPRFLTAQIAEQVSLGRKLSPIVAITEFAAESGVSSASKPLDFPPQGATVTVVVSAPGLTVDGELQQEIVVPAAGDSDPCRFAFVANSAGQHTLTIQAYRGGTFLGSVRTQVLVDVGVSMTEGKRKAAELGSGAFEAGEVTLQVSHTSAGYSFQLLGDPICRPQFGPLADDPAPIVSQIAAELREMAAGRSPFSTAKQVKNRLTNLGVKLWSAVVPVAVQNQFWEQRDRIKTFTIVSDQDVIPWELLYPVNGANENGFLAEQFPVVRRTYDAGRRVQRIPMNSAAYVIPESSPENALTEVDKIRALLGVGVQDRGTLSRLDDVTAMIDDVPGVVHFACHNTFPTLPARRSIWWADRGRRPISRWPTRGYRWPRQPRWSSSTRAGPLVRPTGSPSCPDGRQNSRPPAPGRSSARCGPFVPAAHCSSSKSSTGHSSRRMRPWAWPRCRPARQLPRRTAIPPGSRTRCMETRPPAPDWRRRHERPSICHSRDRSQRPGRFHRDGHSPAERGRRCDAAPVYWGDLGANNRFGDRTIPGAGTRAEVRGTGGPSEIRDHAADGARIRDLAEMLAGGDAPTEIRDGTVPQTVIDAALANLPAAGEEIRDDVTVAEEVRAAIADQWPGTQWLRLVQDPLLLDAVGSALTEPLTDLRPASPIQPQAPAGRYEIRDETPPVRPDPDPAQAAIELRGVDIGGFLRRRVQDLDRVVGAAFGAAGGTLNAYLRTSLLPGITRFAGDVLVYQRHRAEVGQRVRDVIHDVDSAAGLDADHPVTIVAHSLGGVIAVDLATSDDPLWVRSLVTFGSQSPFFHVADPRAGTLLPFGGDQPVRLPPSLGAWTNLWEPLDPLACIAGTVFQLHDGARPDDEEVGHLVSSGLWTHSAYWELDAQFEAVRKAVRQPGHARHPPESCLVDTG